MKYISKFSIFESIEFIKDRIDPTIISDIFYDFAEKYNLSRAESDNPFIYKAFEHRGINQYMVQHYFHKSEKSSHWLYGKDYMEYRIRISILMNEYDTDTDTFTRLIFKQYPEIFKDINLFAKRVDSYARSVGCKIIKDSGVNDNGRYEQQSLFSINFYPGGSDGTEFRELEVSIKIENA